MNNTKWMELVAAVGKLPFGPAFQVKSILGKEPYPPTFEEDVWHGGAWSELYPYYEIEWIRVRPRILKGRGQLLPLSVEDIEKEFVAVLQKVGIPHRRSGSCIQIFGYAESTNGLSCAERPESSEQTTKDARSETNFARL